MSQNKFQSYFTNPDFVGSRNAIREKSANAYKKGIVYLEDDSDTTFWEKIIGRYYPNKYTFQTATKSIQGKRKLEHFYDKASIKVLIAVDGDYDYIKSGFDLEHEFNGNPFVLHTYSFSRESVLCEANRLQLFFNQCKYTISHQVDVVNFLQRFSSLVWYGLVKFITAKEFDGSQNYVESEFHKCFHLTDQTLIKEDLTIDCSMLNKIENNFKIFFIDDFKKSDLSKTENTLSKLGINQKNAHRFISGHTLDELIRHIHKSMLNKLGTQEIEKIKSNITQNNSESDNGESLKKQNKMIGDRISQLNKQLKPRSNIDTFFNLYDINSDDDIQRKILERVKALTMNN